MSENNGPWGNMGGGNDGRGGGRGSGGGSGGGPRNPWGGGGSGGGGGDGPPNLDEILRRGQERFRRSMPGGSGGAMPAIIVGALALFWLATSSVYRVNADEVGVVQRLGAFVRQTGPGLHFKLPSPVETVVRPRVMQDNTIEIGTSGEEGPENLVLTGDQNIVDIAYTVRWRIKDAPNFLFQLENPEETIREVAESAMRASVSATPLNDAIGPQRSAIAGAVQRHLQDVLDSYKSGVEISGVFFKQVDPPAAVEDSFKDVSSAQQDAERFTNQANAYRQQLVARAQGDAARFNAVYAQYALAPEVTRKRIYLETMEDVLTGMTKVVVEAKGVVPYLPLAEMQRRATPPTAPAVTAAPSSSSQGGAMPLPAPAADRTF